MRLVGGLLLMLALAGLGLALAAFGATPPRVPRDAAKCGRVLVSAMWKAPGIVLPTDPVCRTFNPQVIIPDRFRVERNTNPLVVDIYFRRTRIGSVVLAEAPPPSLTIHDKRPRPFATARRTEAGVEFVEVVPGALPPLSLKESRP